MPSWPWLNLLTFGFWTVSLLGLIQYNLSIELHFQDLWTVWVSDPQELIAWLGPPCGWKPTGPEGRAFTSRVQKFVSGPSLVVMQCTFSLWLQTGEVSTQATLLEPWSLELLKVATRWSAVAQTPHQTPGTQQTAESSCLLSAVETVRHICPVLCEHSKF